MRDFTTYTIPKGGQYMKGRIPKVFIGKAMRRIARFNSSTAYKSLTEENQWDVNKLFGFTDGLLTKYDNRKKKYRWANSARFGWDYREGVLRLYAYVYVNGERIVKELGPVLMDKDYELTILALGSTTKPEYVFFVKPLDPAEDEPLGAVVYMPRGSKAKTVVGFHLFFFFGGDDPAPHDVTIQMRKP